MDRPPCLLPYFFAATLMLAMAPCCSSLSWLGHNSYLPWLLFDRTFPELSCACLFS